MSLASVPPSLIPDLNRFGEHFVVSFPVRRLPDAEVLWLNDGWWFSHGWNLFAPGVRDDLAAELKAVFGVVALGPERGASDGPILLADRYGSSFGTRGHGGSGRCGSVGQFSAKGVGRTPLVAETNKGGHSDGRLSLAEALREAVASEIAHLELPYGAAPVVAILVTGAADNDPVVGEAILVRPNVLRPAHFERSIFFGSSGFKGSDQHLDALRTQDFVRLASADLVPGFPGLEPMFDRFAQQIGAGQAHRLWQGRFLSSNVTINGALIDFGSFRSTPSWRRFRGQPEEVFGDENVYLQAAVSSLSATFAKYAPDHPQAEASSRQRRLASSVKSSFWDAVTSSLHLDSIDGSRGDNICELLYGYFNRQQSELVDVEDRKNWRLPWINDILIGSKWGEDSSLLVEYSTLKEIWSNLSHLPQQRAHCLMHSLLRWTLPRPSLYYEHSAIVLERASRAIRRNRWNQQSIAVATLNHLLSSTPRFWRDLPPAFELRGQTHLGHSTVLYGFDHDRCAWTALTRGSPFQDMEALFGAFVPRQIATPWRDSPCDEGAIRTGFTLRLAKAEISVPPAAFLLPPLRDDIITVAR